MRGTQKNILQAGMKRLLWLFFFCAAFIAAVAQQPSVEFKSTDTALQTAFYRAKEMALFYKGDKNDPVGPWYEAALPSRNAFCIRDVSHQVIAAEVLGLGAANKNMLTLFVSNISESKDWCTYWEMNKFGKPAPEDYRNDTAFWYNLNANFELIYTCWRMYLWTGDKSYIANPLFTKFFDISVSKYTDRWILQIDSLLKRPAYPNAPMPFNFNDYFHRCRGIPSYYEAVMDMRMSSDLIAAIVRALKSYAAIAILKGDKKTAATYEQKAEVYRRHLEKVWWNNETKQYHNYFTNKNSFGKGEGETFLLWYDVLTDSSRIKHTINYLLGKEWNVENLSYLPYQLCRYGYSENAYGYILQLTDPETKRREYPEVSFGVIEGIVQGIMGVEADVRYNRIATINNSHTNHSSELRNLNILSSPIRIKHWAKGSTFSNGGTKAINWRATFHGQIPYVKVNGKNRKTVQQTDRMGNKKSSIDVQVLPGKSITVVVA
jgi:hypothetical protein